MAPIQPDKIYKIIVASNPNSPNIGKRCKTIEVQRVTGPMPVEILKLLKEQK